jgi:hypothetical protein
MEFIDLLVMSIIYQRWKATYWVNLEQLLEKRYEIKMKDHTLTLLDTKRVMIAKVVMINNRMFLLNIEMDMFKCMCEGWDWALAYETWACKLW